MITALDSALLAEAERYYRLHYGIPSRPLDRAIGSDHHSLAEELALEHAGIPVPHPRRSLCENAHKRTQ